jgi:hypothetical protein
MPPPLLIEFFHYLISFRRTNMDRKNDFAKFFSAPFSVHPKMSTFTHAFQLLLYPARSLQLRANALANPLGTSVRLHPDSSAGLGRSGQRRLDPYD